MNKEGHVLNGALLALGLGVILVVDPTMGPLVEETPSALALAAATKVAELSLPVVLGALFPDVDTAFGKHRKTLHNLPVLAIFLVFPYVFGNLQYVWVGVATHYVLDMVGSRRGIALFYPFSSKEYDLPTGVTTSSKWANPVTFVVTAFELAVLAVVHYYVFALDTSFAEAAALVGAF
ncbi:metal-dependent hydrolase [Halogeometricum limi]|uniref:LexA-binding, inner membrane-associated putative hydrolase n=1 Tax=Halogeometricum limi TaxID=555875 RepID=A0A1I6G5M1_9EURY|nr:metal-dependent hydrolase [Halogeometricum limi]SFR37472.1 LexA-binding, inner membrane-associated putative hydrolase [Halogeometricum limi]